MIICDAWMKVFLEKILKQFGSRLCFLGLQGSYGRGEAGESSDIDPVVILDELDAKTLAAYRALLDEMPDRALCCGFVSGMEEIKNWDAADFFQLYYDVTPYYGSLEALASRLDRSAVCRAVHLGACNIYHICAHNYLHGRKNKTLCGQLKAAAFVLQALHFVRTGEYVRRHAELLPLLPERDREIMQFSLTAKANASVLEEKWEHVSMLLWQWAGDLIKEYGE